MGRMICQHIAKDDVDETYCGRDILSSRRSIFGQDSLHADIRREVGDGLRSGSYFIIGDVITPERYFCEDCFTLAMDDITFPGHEDYIDDRYAHGVCTAYNGSTFTYCGFPSHLLSRYDHAILRDDTWRKIQPVFNANWLTCPACSSQMVDDICSVPD